MDDTTRLLRGRTGLDVVGCYAFGNGPEQADELLAFVTRGTKRATVGASIERAEFAERLPTVGQLWGLLDGAGEPRYVVETIDVVPGRLDEVTPAFAWDEGEDDGTLESWWQRHRRWGIQLGVADPERLEVMFERFRVVWPVPDRTTWLAEGVRELRHDERSWLRETRLARHGAVEVEGHGERGPVDGVPALVCERGGQRVGTVSFRPRPGAETIAFALDATDGEVAARLKRGLTELGRRHRWERILPPPDETTDPRPDGREGREAHEDRWR